VTFLHIEEKSGKVEEGGVKVEEIKGGWGRVWRAVPRQE
jgi:hypothetical protein